MNPISIRVAEHAGSARRSEVVTTGVPLPRGLAQPSQAWLVRSTSGEVHPCQTAPRALWPDGSVRWLAVTFPVSIGARESADYSLAPATDAPGDVGPRIALTKSEHAYEIDTGPARFRLLQRGSRLLEGLTGLARAALDSPSLTAQLVDRRGRQHFVAVNSAQLLERGPLLARFCFHGSIPRSGLLVQGEWIFRAGSACAELNLTLHNPSRARHTQGCWDLGDPGSVLFRSFSLNLRLASNPDAAILYREQLTGDWRQQAGGLAAIQQHTSGGDNDRSRNHVNRCGRVPESTSGYTAQSSSGNCSGRRAEPLFTVQHSGGVAIAGIHEFWQQFPKRLGASPSEIELGIFPELPGDLHEVQGGEQKTTRIAMALNADAAHNAEPLAVLAPLEVRCAGDWMVATGAVWRLPRQNARLRREWQTVAEHAVHGPRGFFAKRETADEYGWRNFGDLWADHEEAYYRGPRPIVSHYNNQYDALEGFLLAYLVTGERRLWELADPLARHLIDIDIYHTTQDRAAFNGGQFWHTNHYLDAATATHRGYSKVNHPGGGGGPSNEHNYSSGLLLYHFLTGYEPARAAVVGLAEWVLNMDDGRRHVLGLVQEGSTGFASRTTESSYHSPGRGAGNSINTLLDGWLASNRPVFLEKTEELIRRSIHPDDDITALDLGNAELRWSYTVFLQTLIRCLATCELCPLGNDLIAYVRDSLLHYARWMAAHESFYLDRPEQLEFPTETWAAQELRKANILFAAGELADAHEAARFRERAAWFEDRAWTTLMKFPTWHFTRPTVLALQLGLYAAACSDRANFAQTPHNGVAWHAASQRTRFLPQKERVRRGLRSPSQLLAMLARAGRVWHWPRHVESTWFAQRVRHFWGQFVG